MLVLQVYLQVWRQEPSRRRGERVQFELVGQTQVRYRNRGTYAVADNIQVRPTCSSRGFEVAGTWVFFAALEGNGLPFSLEQIVHPHHGQYQELKRFWYRFELSEGRWGGTLGPVSEALCVCV